MSSKPKQESTKPGSRKGRNSPLKGDSKQQSSESASLSTASSTPSSVQQWFPINRYFKKGDESVEGQLLSRLPVVTPDSLEREGHLVVVARKSVNDFEVRRFRTEQDSTYAFAQYKQKGWSSIVAEYKDDRLVWLNSIRRGEEAVFRQYLESDSRDSDAMDTSSRPSARSRARLSSSRVSFVDPETCRDFQGANAMHYLATSVLTDTVFDMMYNVLASTHAVDRLFHQPDNNGVPPIVQAIRAKNRRFIERTIDLISDPTESVSEQIKASLLEIAQSAQLGPDMLTLLVHRAIPLHKMAAASHPYTGWMLGWTGHHHDKAVFACQLLGSTCDRDRHDMWKEAVKLCGYPKHPNLFNFLGFFMSRSEIGYMVEFAATSSLSARIREAPLKRTEMYSVLSQLAEVLPVLHARKLVHGRLNPDYLLLEGTTVKLADPGMGCVLSQFFGTTVNNPLAYFAPEMLNEASTLPKNPAVGSELRRSQAIDMYSVGCLIVQFYTDQFPWQGCDDIVEELVIKHRMLPQLQFVDDEDARNFAMKCLDGDPLRRPTAEVFREWTKRFRPPTNRVAAPVSNAPVPMTYINAKDVTSAKGLAFAFGYSLKWFRCHKEFLLKEEELEKPQYRDMSSPSWLCQFTDFEQMLLHVANRKSDPCVSTLQKANSIVSIDDPAMRSKVTKDYLCAEAHQFSLAFQSYMRAQTPPPKPPTRPTTLLVVDSTRREAGIEDRELAYGVIEETKRIGTEVSLHVVGYYAETSQVSTVGRDLTRLVVEGSHVVDVQSPPEAYVCPLSQKVMRDAVTACDGHTYERADFEAYVRNTRPLVSPVSQRPMKSADTKPNNELQNTINKYLQQRRWWKQRLAPYDVVVLTAKLLLDFLRRGVLGLHEFSTIIVDDCHRARAYKKTCTHQTQQCFCPENRPPHPFYIVMGKYYERGDVKPRVLGLTPSPVDAKGFAAADTGERLHSWIEITMTLERALRSTLLFIPDKTSLREYRPVPECDIVRHAAFRESKSIPLLRLERAEIDLPDGDSDVDELTSGSLIIQDLDKQSIRAYAAINSIVEELGPWCARIALWLGSGGPTHDPLQEAKARFIEISRKDKQTFLLRQRAKEIPFVPEDNQPEAAQPSAVQRAPSELEARLRAEFTQLTEDTEIADTNDPSKISMYLASQAYGEMMYANGTFNLKEVAPKLVTLVTRIKQTLEDGDDRSVLVWVERRLTAGAVAAFLKMCSRAFGMFQGTVQCLMGRPSPSNVLGMTKDEQETILLGFGQHCQILVATPDSILGRSDPTGASVDVVRVTPAVVIVFDLVEPPMDCVDRAAVPSPLYIKLAGEEDNVDEQPESYSDDDKEEEKVVYPEPMPEEKDEIIEIPFAGKVSLNNSVSLLDRYCAKHQKERAVFKFLEVPDDGFQCEVRLGWIHDQPFVGKLCSKKRMAKASAAFMVCKELHERKELSELLLPPAALRKKKARIKKVPGTIPAGEEIPFGVAQAQQAQQVPSADGSSSGPERPAPAPKSAVKTVATHELKVPFNLQKGWRVQSSLSTDSDDVQASPMVEELVSGNAVPFYVYHIVSKDDVPWNFALLNRVPLPLDELSPISVYPEPGDKATEFRFVYRGRTSLTDSELAAAERFHMQMFSFLLKLDKHDFRDKGKMYLVLPIDMTDGRLQLPEPQRTPEFGCGLCRFVGPSKHALERHIRGAKHQRRSQVSQRKGLPERDTEQPAVEGDNLPPKLQKQMVTKSKQKQEYADELKRKRTLELSKIKAGVADLEPASIPGYQPPPGGESNKRTFEFSFTKVDMEPHFEAKFETQLVHQKFIAAIDKAWMTAMEVTLISEPAKRAMDQTRFKAALSLIYANAPSFELDQEHIGKFFTLLCRNIQLRISYYEFRIGVTWLGEPKPNSRHPASDCVAACYFVIFESHPRMPSLFIGPCTPATAEKALTTVQSNAKQSTPTSIVAISLANQQRQLILSRKTQTGISHTELLAIDESTGTLSLRQNAEIEQYRRNGGVRFGKMDSWHVIEHNVRQNLITFNRNFLRS